MKKIRAIEFVMSADLRVWHCAAVLLLLTSIASADSLERSKVPEPLHPWVDWVLRDHENELCPFLQEQGYADRPACVWPSSLSLKLDDRGGAFTQTWRVHAEARVPLPGDRKRWPEEVQANGRPVPVVESGGSPQVKLEAGDYTLSGRFHWKELPELLQIPPETGLLSLALRGQEVGFPNRDTSGRLWLQKRADAEPSQASRVEVVVHRRAIDEIPLLLETRIELRVSGKSREVVLGHALPGGFVAMALDSPLPARLDPDGRLRAQVRPGTWNLVVRARHEGPASSLAAPEQRASERDGAWDSHEVWVFEARPHLRRVDVEGGTLLDPTQTAIPREWQHLPTYLMEPGHSLKLVETRRGDEDPAPDSLEMTRTWWLNFAGDGFTVTDRILGVMRRSTRLEMGEGVDLGRVALDGRDQTITRVEGSTTSGIEVPRGAIEITADSRVTGRDDLSAVGWNQDFQALSAVLHLPPGWRLFHASGVDRASTTWLNRWTLLDLFLVLVTATAVFRLWGLGWGILALAALGLSFTEPGAPQWAWVAALVGEGLVRARPQGRFRRAAGLYRGLAMAALLLILIPFGVNEVRVGLHPALAGVDSSPMFQRADMSLSDKMMERRQRKAGGYADEEVVVMQEVPAAEESASPSLGRVSSPLKTKAYDYTYTPDPGARITTGPGLPTWQWGRVSLSWSGPVEKSQPLHFTLIPPALNALLAFVRVALLSGLVLRLLWGLIGRGSPWRPSPGSISAAVALIASCALLAPASARADFPSPELLEDLRSRLLEKPDCHPRCAASPRLQLQVSPESLDLRMQVNVEASTAVPLPGGARSWEPRTVLVDDTPAAALRRESDGTLWVQLDPGRHQLVLRGPLPNRDSVDLPLPLRPHRVDAQVRGWVLHGLHEDGQAESSLQLSRIRDAHDDAEGSLDPGELPPFVRVERNLELGLDWKLKTRVARITPANTAAVLAIPLLAGESITTDGIQVRDGKALVSMAPGVNRAAWTSVLDAQPELVLRAPEAVPWTEVWRLDVSPVWHVEAAGIPPIHQPSSSGARIREWRPWPGEEVKLSATRPAGVEGPTLTIDASTLTFDPGLRSSDARLALSLRSSRGGQHTLTLPDDVVLQEVTIDGTVQPIRLQNQRVSLPLKPGRQQIELRWREPRGIANGLLFRTSRVDLGAPSVNAEVEVAPSVGRWILLAGGPRLGPAVLFWPLLGVMALLSFGLGRVTLTPLRFRHWMLLAVGLTQVPIVLAAVVVVWLLALGWRRERGAGASARWFDLLQVVIGGLTIAAIGVLFLSITEGLLGTPSMQIDGNGSSADLLRWYQDRVAASPPACWILSVPLLVYRFAMLAWALWLAQALVRWLRWGWECFSAGDLWRPLRRPATPAPAHEESSN